MRALELKIPPAVLVLLAGAAMWFAAAALPSLFFPFSGRLAASLALAGVLVCVSGVASFRRAKTTVNPMHPGSASSLVVAGVYRFTRNPMYLGFLLILGAWALYLSNVVALLGLPAFVVYMNAFQIVPEERALAALFPDAFQEYKSTVRRWI